MDIKKNKFNSDNLILIGNFILWAVFLITIIAVFVPFYPVMPSTGIDPSWVFGTDQAVAQGLSFGKDIIFTMGPYVSIYTKLYHPSIDLMMVTGGIYLALSYWLGFVLLMKGVKWRWVLFFYVFLTGLMYSLDALFFSYPLMVGLLIYKMLFLGKGQFVKGKLVPVYVALLFAPFGLLPLIKGSMLILCFAIAVLCSVFFIVNKKRFFTIICLSSPFVSMFFFWIASGQFVVDLPAYFISMMPIISGYTEAMAVDGPIREVVLYLIASGLLLIGILIQKKIINTSKIFLFCIYFVFLFLSFKAGFVRHDGHAITAGTSILIASLLFPFVFKSKFVYPITIFALLVWFCINNNYIKISPESISKNIVSTYSSAWVGIKNRIENKNWPRLEFDVAMNSLRGEASFPVLQGTTDIYSYNQAYLIASGNSWAPRPILQSHAAYTPALVEINKKHLLGAQAPDNVIFRVEPIDGRLPSLEDGASWPILMLNYQPTQMENYFLFLQKNKNTSEFEEPLKLKSEKHKFGESVSLPQSIQPIFAQIDISPTILGRIANFLYKTSQLQITIELENGVKKQYRIIAGMAASGFLISPLIENTEEFGMLYDEGFLDEKLVKAITITPSNGGINLWNDEYNVTFSQVKASVPIDISKIYKFDGFDDELSVAKVTTVEKCDGSIDVVNDVTAVSTGLSVSGGLLRVTGWIVDSVEKGTLPKAVYVVLTDDKGNHKYLRTKTFSRPDVGGYFKKPELNESGYSTTTDVLGLEGKYTLGLALKTSDDVKICTQFKIPLTIK